MIFLTTNTTNTLELVGAMVGTWVVAMLVTIGVALLITYVVYQLTIGRRVRLIRKGEKIIDDVMNIVHRKRW